MTVHHFQRQGTFFQTGAHTAAAQQAHDQVGHAGFAPVVVERDDVGMFQPGDELGFGFEAADEVGLVGVLGADDLERHLTLDQRLGGAIHNPHAALTDAFAQGIAANGPAGEVFQADLLGARRGVTGSGARSARPRRTKSARSSCGMPSAMARRSAIWREGRRSSCSILRSVIGAQPTRWASSSWVRPISRRRALTSCPNDLSAHIPSHRSPVREAIPAFPISLYNFYGHFSRD